LRLRNTFVAKTNSISESSSRFYLAIFNVPNNFQTEGAKKLTHRKNTLHTLIDLREDEQFLLQIWRCFVDDVEELIHHREDTISEVGMSGQEKFENRIVCSYMGTGSGCYCT
jgi:hypothetical protein